MRRRNRETRAAVRYADRCARLAITLGGLGTIAIVSTVFLFLVWVVLPLFGSTSLSSDEQEVQSVAFADSTRVVVDEYGSLAWSYSAQGQLALFRPDSGEVLEEAPLVPNSVVTAAAFAPNDDSVVAGFADGTIRFGDLRFGSSFRKEAELEHRPALELGARVTTNGGVAERVQDAAVRLVTLTRSFSDPISLGTSGSPVVALDYSVSAAAQTLAAVTADATLHVKRVVTRRNMLTGAETFTLSGGEVALDLPDGQGLPYFVALKGLGDGVFLVWRDGHLQRFDARDPRQPSHVENVDLLGSAHSEQDEKRTSQVTALGFLIGKKTLLVGQDDGTITGWFGIKPDATDRKDGVELTRAWSVEGATEQPVVSLAASARSRMFAAGYADGNVALFQATTRQRLDLAAAAASAVTALAIAPKDDVIVAVASGELAVLGIELAHPEVSLSTLFAPVWYEGYPSADHVWQSSSGTDDFEPKLGLMPLIFGTIKATVYSMLFGLPLALLAAIYTSEFLKPVVRARIKPTIELMASLPSVVLGFLGALVIAPFLEQVLPETLASVFLIPYGLLLGAHLWQLVPSPLRARMSGRRFLMCIAVIPVCVLVAIAIGPWLERAMFGGDIMLWLDGGIEESRGAWVVLLLPAVALLCSWSFARTSAIDHIFVRVFGDRAELVALLQFLFLTAVALLVSWTIGSMLDSLGFDPRGGLLNTYVQRNALIVGFVMGFAVVPIVYTLAEDALSSIPESLRAGSLALGATPWQTAVRIVVPTAMSGLFSAMMVGLGRAVGETMIVLMAAGNTPVMDWNIFNGFRTLSANIAVELPEAVQNSTHYRTLFLAALVLFGLTFLLNTAAELVRQRFRKRAFQL